MRVMVTDSGSRVISMLILTPRSFQPYPWMNLHLSVSIQRVSTEKGRWLCGRGDDIWRFALRFEAYRRFHVVTFVGVLQLKHAVVASTKMLHVVRHRVVFDLRLIVEKWFRAGHIEDSGCRGAVLSNFGKDEHAISCGFSQDFFIVRFKIVLVQVVALILR